MHINWHNPTLYVKLCSTTWPNIYWLDQPVQWDYSEWDLIFGSNYWGRCVYECACVSSYGRAKAITWPLVPLITYFRGSEKQKVWVGVRWVISIFLEEKQKYGRHSMVVWMWVCFGCDVISESLLLRVCAQMFVMAVTQEANGSLAKTTPQNVCQIIPGRKCQPTLSQPLLLLHLRPSVQIYLTLLLKVRLGELLWSR